MKTIFSKKIIFSALFLLVMSGFLYFVPRAFAATPPDLGISYGAEIGLPATDIRLVIARIIRAALGLLGIVAVALIIYAGFMWMTAGGDDEKVGTAKKILINAVIGLAIILTSYAIVSFVMNKLIEATTGVPGHCSDTVQNEDETGLDCGGSCSACSVPNNYAASGGFYISSLPGTGPLCLRNVHPMLIFSKDVDITTLNGNANLILQSNSSTAAGVWAYGDRRTIAVFNPDGVCAPEAPARNDCLAATSTYALHFNNVANIKSEQSFGVNPEPLIGCRDKTNGRISLGSCNSVSFTTGVSIDTTPPTINFIAPPFGAGFSQGSAVNIRLHFKDDLGIQNLALYEGNALIVSQSFDGCQAEGEVSLTWPTAGLNAGPHTLTAIDADWTSATGTESRNLALLAPHCFDGIKTLNTDEEKVDCGGADCRSCDGTICTNNNQCAGGICENGVCLSRMIITGFSPASGASSNYVTIAGKLFGGSEGDGGVYFSAARHLGGSGIFSARVNKSVGVQPSSVIISDVSGDGRPDLVVIAGEVVSVLLGNGDGNFADKVDYNAGLGPSFVDAGDFNLDGKVDLAVSHYGDNFVSVLLNTGGGVFPTAVNYPTGPGPATLSVGDVNGDSKPDIVVPISAGSSVSVLLNNGNGIFASGVNYAAGTHPTNIAIADFNADGKQDLAAANSDSATVSVLLNTGNGIFAAKADYGVGANSRFISAGDLNADGRPDLVVANTDSATVSVLLNTGNGIFASQVSYATGLAPYFVVIGDLNGDGKPDLATANLQSYTVSILINNGGGTFAGKADYPTGASPESARIGDLNGDGKPDLVFVNWGDATVSVLINKSNSTTQWAKADLVICAGSSSAGWSDRQIIARVPEGVITGPIRVVRGDKRFTDLTNDDFGPMLSDFQINNIIRPGICAIEPNKGAPEDRVVIIGQKFGLAIDNVADKVMFGDTPAAVSLNNWADKSIITSVPILNPGAYGASVFNNGIESNSIRFDVANTSVENLPQIFSISPTSTAAGGYITIEGRNFGDTTGLVYFKSDRTSPALNGNTSFPSVCAAGVWADNKLIVKFPSDVGGLAGTNYFVQVRNSEKRNVSVLDDNIRFKLVDGDPVPGICRINPVSAPIPYPPTSPAMTIAGEYFGANKDLIDVKFFGPVLAVKDDNFTINSAGTLINLRPPNNTKTGPVNVIRTLDGKPSNPAYFTASDCRLAAPNKPANTCVAIGMRCCVATGACLSGSDLCGSEIRAAGYVWRFSTQTIPAMPHVLEQCDGATVIPSPSPSILNSGSGFANDVCITALAMVEFSTLMDADSIVVPTLANSDSNIIVNRCAGNTASTIVGVCIDPVRMELTPDSYILKPGTQNTHYLSLQTIRGTETKWLQNTYYQVALLASVHSAEGHMPLAADKPCDVPGSSYCYTFKTGSEECSLGQVLVTPTSFRTSILERLIKFRVPGAPEAPLVYRGLGLSEQRCIAMDMTGFTWGWQAENRGGGPFAVANEPTTAFTTAGALANTIGEDSLTQPRNAVNLAGTATRPATAIFSAEEPKTGRSPLTIDLSHPEVVDRWPNCLEACTNAEVGVRFNTTMSDFERIRNGNSISTNSISPGSVRLYKCLDENCVGVEQVNSGQSYSFEEDRTTLIIKYDPAALAPGTLYKAVLSAPSTTPAFPQLGTGVSVADRTAFGFPFDEAYSWRFRTKATPCVINSVAVNPPLYQALSAEDRAVFSASAVSSPDACNATGQKLNALSIGWNWTAADIFPVNPVASNVAKIQQFVWRGYNKNCTASCVRKGSAIPHLNIILPLCGNGIIEAGEDCDAPAFTARCALNCLFTVGRNTGSDAQTAAAAVDASICGNGTVGNSEDCDLGIAPAPALPTSAYGCSARCLHLGTPLSNQWCATHLADHGGFSVDQYKSACATALSQCGNGVPEPSEDPICDFGHKDSNGNYMVDAACNSFCLLKTGDAPDDVDNNSCAGSESFYSGCSVSAHKHLGSSLLYTDPSVCGDGITGLGEDDYCEDTNFFSVTNNIPYVAGNLSYIHNPWALVVGVGRGEVDQTVSPPAERSAVTVGTNQNINSDNDIKTGQGEFRISCGFTRDEQCPSGQGVGYDSCCYARPTITAKTPAADVARGVCPNTAIEAVFSNPIDAKTVPSSFILAKGVNAGSCPIGTMDVTTLISAPVVYNAPSSWFNAIWTKVASLIKGLFGSVVEADGPVWCADPKSGLSTLSENDAKILNMQLAKPLDTNSYYVLMIREGLRDTNGVSVGLGADNKPINWRFHTAGAVCTVNSVYVDPPSQGYYRAYTSSTFFANALSARGGELQPIPGYYDWNYLWGPPNNIVAFAATNTIHSDNSIASKNMNGELDARAAAHILADRYTGTVGNMINGRTHILVSLCENNWPPMHLPDGTDAPFLIIPYADKVGSRAGFDLTRNIFDYSLLPPAERGGFFNFSTYYCADNGGSGTADDLPYLRPAVQTTQAAFNQKGTCAQTDTLCASDADCVVGTEHFTCQKNTILKRFIFTNDKNSDAIGFTVFANQNNLTANEWYAKDKSAGGQGFVGEVQSLKVDGYDAVTDGNNIYVDALNAATATDSRYNIYGDIYLFSVNADAKPETKKIFQTLIGNLKFNINLANDGYCGLTVDAADMTDKCSTDMDCLGGKVCVAQKDKLKRNYTRLRDASMIESALSNYALANNGEFPTLTAGTFLSGQVISTWPSWTAAFSNALGRTMPSDPVNRLGPAGTCTPSSTPSTLAAFNRFCLTDADCAPDKCTLHDINTGWSDANRRFSYACSVPSMAYRYIARSASAYDLRMRMERPFALANDQAIANWSSFVEAFIPMRMVRTRFYLDESNGICTQGNEITSLQQGRCGDGKINLIQNSNPPRMEDCDPPRTERFSSCDATTGKITVDVCDSQCLWTASTTPSRDSKVLCSYASKCGNGIKEAGEICDEGASLNSNSTPGHCNTSCSGFAAATCGNFLVNAGELCDWSVGKNTSLFQPLPWASGTCASNPALACYNNSECPQVSDGCWDDSSGTKITGSCQNDSECNVAGKCSVSQAVCSAGSPCNASSVTIATVPSKFNAKITHLAGTCAASPTTCADLGLTGSNLASCRGVTGNQANCVLRNKPSGLGSSQYSCTFENMTDRFVNTTFFVSSCVMDSALNAWFCSATGFDPSPLPAVIKCPHFQIDIGFYSDKDLTTQTCESTDYSCHLSGGVCALPASTLFTNPLGNIIIDDGLHLRYGFSKNSSCNFDCKSYGPYCGNGILEKNYGEACEGDQSCTVGGVSGKKLCGENCQLSSSATAWWRFENNQNGFWYDFAGGNMARSAAGSYPVVGAGKYGTAAFFDGSSYLEVGHNDKLMSVDSFSVEAWIKPTGNSTGYQRILEKGGWQQGGGYALEYGDDWDSSIKNDIRFLVYNSGVDTPAVLNSGSLTIGSWAHIVGVYTNKKMRLFVNGQLQNAEMKDRDGVRLSSQDYVIAASNQPLVIGASGQAARTNKFVGSIDEIAYYNYALSDAEVVDHKNSTDGRYCTIPPQALASGAQPGSCGDGVQGPSEACDNGQSNGAACNPSYGRACTYCSSDCVTRVTVEPSQRCGDGIIQGVEVCDRLAHEPQIWVRNSSPSLTGSTLIAPHNGYLGLTCEQQFNRKVNTFASVTATSPHNKGVAECVNSCGLFTGSACVSCGVDWQTGVEVKGNILNVLEPQSNNNGVAKVNELRLLFGDANNVVNDNQHNVAFDFNITTRRDYALTTWPVAPTPSSAFVLAKINSNDLCSAPVGEHYFLIINNDLTHPWDWRVSARPVAGQYDLILSPVINANAPLLNNNQEKDNIRVVLKWQGDGELFGGFVFGPPTSPNFDVPIDNVSLAANSPQPYYATLASPANRYAVLWNHGAGTTPSRWHAKAYTINTGPVYDWQNSDPDSLYLDNDAVYAFYVRADRIAAYQNIPVVVEVYFPESDSANDHFTVASSTFTFSLRQAKTSSNTTAAFWQVFNIFGDKVPGFIDQPVNLRVKYATTQTLVPDTSTADPNDSTPVYTPERHGKIVTGWQNITP
ncbi:MAG: FG-GAP-like repeat-containing protein [bacterium]|nr:FG-GAP-like repeat-containing protein [bacterium]